jgi:RNA ligase (TIGR02306 family)
MTKAAHHQVNVVRIEQILPHPNADKLDIIPVGGYQAIVAKGQFKVGDLGYYIQPDSIVPDRPEYAFVWGNATYEGGTPERKRRIAARKLRKEWSEGLLMPYPQTREFIDKCGEPNFNVGDDISDALGITHYNPPEQGETLVQGGSTAKQGYPRTLRGWINRIKSWFRGERREERGLDVPTYDVDAFKKFANTLKEGELVQATEKIHGSNARYSFRPKTFMQREKMWAGSRNLWKSESSSCAWRQALKDNPHIEEFCKAHPGYTIYGEITPMQGGFDYGTPKGRIDFWLFDILTPERKWAEVTDPAYADWLKLPGAKVVPPLYSGPFNIEELKKHVDGQTTTPGKHIREGIVIKTIPERTERGVGRCQLKLVSNVYLEKATKE